MFGDGATTLRSPLIHALSSGVHDESGLLDAADCMGYAAKCFKKDVEQIDKLLAPYI